MFETSELVEGPKTERRFGALPNKICSDFTTEDTEMHSDVSVIPCVPRGEINRVIDRELIPGTCDLCAYSNGGCTLVPDFRGQPASSFLYNPYRYSEKTACQRAPLRLGENYRCREWRRSFPRG